MALNSLIRSLVQIRFCKNTLSSSISLQHYSSHSLRLICCYSTENRKKNIPQDFNTFVLNKYTNYIKNFENLLAKRFPKAMTVYRGFMDGVPLFYQDVKQYVKILAKLNASCKGLNELTRYELEIYNRVPKEMMKLAPVLIGSALPLGYTVMMPLAYLFPKALLTDHFWNAKQREQFNRDSMILRLRQSRTIVKMLTSSNACLQKHVADDKLWILVQAEMKTDQLVYPHKLIGCIDLFKGMPFHLDKLSRMHTMHLAKLHDIRSFWLTKKKLKQRAHLILAMDRAIIREGGIKNLSIEDMRGVCRLRDVASSHTLKSIRHLFGKMSDLELRPWSHEISTCEFPKATVCRQLSIFQSICATTHVQCLYADEMNLNEMKQWLNKWMHVSVAADENSLSFVLHASAILGYNMPANKKLFKSSGNTLNKLRMNSRAALKRMTN